MAGLDGETQRESPLSRAISPQFWLPPFLPVCYFLCCLGFFSLVFLFLLLHSHVTFSVPADTSCSQLLWSAMCECACIHGWGGLNTGEHVGLNRCVPISEPLGTGALERPRYGILPRDLGPEGPHMGPACPKVTPRARSQSWGPLASFVVDAQTSLTCISSSPRAVHSHRGWWC